MQPRRRGRGMDTPEQAVECARLDVALVTVRTRRMAQNGAPTHEIERPDRWKRGGGMVGRYTRGETAGSALRYL